MPIFRCEGQMLTYLLLQTAVADSLKAAMKTAPAHHTTNVNELGVYFERLWSLDINGNGNPVMISLIGMGIVFLSLTFLYLTFAFISNRINNWSRKKVMKETNEDVPKGTDLSVSGEVNAAIAMALHLYLHQLRDEENTVLTIRKVARTYSPWNSKIYNLRQMPQRIPSKRA